MFKNKRIFVLCILLVMCLCSCSKVTATTETIPTEIIPTIEAILPTATLEPIPPTPIPTSLPTPSEITNIYVVKSGDTLWSISQEFGIPMSYIALQNRLYDADEIYADQVLLIPKSADTPPEISVTGKFIVVALSLQKVYVFEDGQLIDDFLVSTGKSSTPTVQGFFYVYLKFDKTRMTGPDYDTPDVPWTMYFYQGYALHGAYWHNNFGTPVSHGCVNFPVSDAEWLYHWTPMDTPVLVLP